MSEPDTAPLGAFGPFHTSTSVRTCFSMGVYTILTRHRTRPALAKTSAVARGGYFSAVSRNIRVVALICLLGSPASAQSVEIAPFAGYRLGNDFFELTANRTVDTDGAPVGGGTVNIVIGDGLVDHWLVGGRQEFGDGRARPHLPGLLGLTRYGTDGDNEVRFVVGCASGVKLVLDRRLDSAGRQCLHQRSWMPNRARQRADPSLSVGVNVQLVWQVEFTA